MKLSLLRAARFAMALGFVAAAALAQEKPFARTFLAGSVESYRVQVLLRVDVHGVATQTIGDKAYVKPYARKAQGTADWTSTRRVLNLSPDGTAQIEETQASISAQCAQESPEDSEGQKLQDSLRELCSRLTTEQTLQYEERADGLIRDLPGDAHLPFGESGLPLLALWLRRSLRPSVIFPSLPFHPGARSQRPIHAADMRGSETIEWMEPGANSSEVALHIVQELSWPEPALNSGFSNVGGQPAGKTTFFSDSTTSVSLLDGSVVSSTRTASRESKRTLDPVEGLAQPPEFSSKLTIVVTIRRVP